MKTSVKRVLRWSAYALLGCTVLVLVLAVLVHCRWFITGCVLPCIHRATPFRIELTSWRFRFRVSLAVENLRVRQVSADGRATNLVAEARSLALGFKPFSLWTDHPVFMSVAAVEPALGLAGIEPGPAGKAAAHSTRKIVAGAGAASAVGIPVIPLPVSVGSLSIRDGHVSYQDASGLRVSVRHLRVEATNVVPHGRAVLAASALLMLNNDKDVAVTRLPVAVTGVVVFGDTAIPGDAIASLSISNVVGRAGGIDLSPLACDLRLDARQTGDTVHVRAGSVRIAWLDALLGNLTATGSFDVLTRTADMGVVLDVNPSPFWQVFLGEHAAVDISKASADAAVAVRARLDTGELDGAGSISVINLQLAPDAGTSPAQTDLDAAFNARFCGMRQTLDITSFRFSAMQSKMPVLSLKAEAPLRFCWSDRAAIQSSLNDQAKISLVLQKLELCQVNALLKGGPARIADGTVSANLVVDVRSLGRRIAARGTLGVENLDALGHSARWRDIDVSASLDAALADYRSLAVPRCVIDLSLDNVPAGQIAAGGSIELDGGSNRIALVVSKLKSEVLQRFIDPERKNRRLEGLDLTLKLLSEKAASPIAPQEIAAGVSIENRFRPGPGEWQRLTFDLQAAAAPEVVRIGKCSLGLSPAAWQDNSLDLVGSIYVVPTNETSELMISSKHFDATTLLDTFMPAPAKQAASAKRPGHAGTQPPAAGKPSAGTDTEPPPLGLDGRSLALDIRLDELRAREMRFVPFQLDVRLVTNVVSVATRDLRPNGGVLSFFANVDLGVTGFVYHAESATTNVPLLPIINTIIPERQDTVDGLLASSASLDGRGITLPSAKRHLRARTSAWLLNGYLYHVPILEEVGTALRIDALREFNFGEGRIETEAADGIVTIRTFALQGSAAKLDMRGTVDFDQRVNLDMYVSVNAKLIPAIVGTKIPFSSALGGYVELPMPIPIRGTLKDKTIGVSYKDILPGLLKALGSKPGELLKGVLDAVPQNEVTKGVSDGIKALEGLFSPAKKSGNQ